MSWTHFVRKNRLSTKHFSAFWEKFSLLRIVLPQSDRRRLKEECQLCHVHHLCPWGGCVSLEHTYITDCCGAERSTRASLLLSIMPSGTAPISPLYHQWEGRHASRSAATTCWRLLCSQCPFPLRLISEKTAAEEKEKNQMSFFHDATNCN